MNTRRKANIRSNSDLAKTLLDLAKVVLVLANLLLDLTKFELHFKAYILKKDCRTGTF